MADLSPAAIASRQNHIANRTVATMSRSRGWKQKVNVVTSTINMLQKTCDRCGQSGTMTYEETNKEGDTTAWIDADGAFVLGKDGKPVCRCQPQ